MMFKKYKRRKLEREFHEHMRQATDVCNLLINLSVSRDSKLGGAHRWVWMERSAVVPTAYRICYQMVEQIFGKPTIDRLVREVTDDIAEAPFEFPSSRSVFCAMLFALQDNDADRATKAWARVTETDKWPEAREVMAMMTAMFGNALSQARE